MKKITLLLFMLTIFVFTSYGQIISQYIEANSGTTPKGIEIWNNTASALDFSANSLVIKKGTNGATPSADYTLSTGTLAPGDVIVIGTSDLQATTEGNGSAFYLKAFTFNGDDALEVWYGSTKTDVFGTPGMDPGSAWSGNGVSTANQNIALLSGITTGDTDGWTDPSTRFETVNTNPSGSGGDEGFGIAPASGSGPDDPSAFTANTVSTSEIDLSWTQNANSDDVMVAWSSDGTFGTPTDGTSYSAGNSITGGGTVLYNGSATTYNHTGLTSGTHYYYKAWSVDGSTNYSSGVTDDATTYKNEPSNHVTGFSATANGSSTIDLSWTENDGAVVPDGYLIKASTGTIGDPSDGTDPTDDTDLTDGSGNVKVAHGTTSYSFTNCSSSTAYNFKIYPYTNSGSAIDYKTDGTVPLASATTAAPDKLIISEVADPGDDYEGRFVELYNAGSSNIDLSTGSWYLTIQVNGGSFSDFVLSGTIHAGETFVTSYSSLSFNTDYGFDSDQNSGFNGSGDDGYFLYKGGDHSTGTLVDAYGVIDEDGTGKAWEYTDSHAVRNSTVTQANSTWTSSEWTISSANVADMTPGTHGDCITFNGSSTSAWGTAGNWVGGTAPTSSNNVKVPAGLTNNPSVDGDATTPSECNSLTIGDTLTIPVNKALTVSGNLTNNGIADGLVIESNATGNGSLIVDGTVIGDATVQRYIAGYTASGNGWHEIGCPVSFYSVAGTDWDPTATGTNNDLYYWDESQNLWMNYRTATFDFSAGNGYLVANDADLTHVFTGTLNNADITVSGLTYTSGQGYGWNLLGNPFPCAIKWNDGNWTLTNLASSTAKVWDYATNPGNYTDLSANDIIPSTNGFLVQVASGSTGSVTIPVAARTHNSTNNYKTATNSEALKIKVTNDQNVYTDITTVGFNGEATDKMDWAFDSHKLFGDPQAPQLWTVSNNEMFSTDYLPYSDAQIELPLSFKAGVDGTYHLTFSGIDSFDANSSIMLEDLFTGKTVDIRKNQTYSYTAAKEDANNRFVLHFYNVTSTPEIGEANNKALIYSYNNNIIVKATDKQLNGKVEIINILGQTMETKSVSNSNFFTINTNLNKGVYIVRYTETNGYTQAQKVIIN